MVNNIEGNTLSTGKLLVAQKEKKTLKMPSCSGLIQAFINCERSNVHMTLPSIDKKCIKKKERGRHLPGYWQ